MEEAAEKGKLSSHCAHANGMNERTKTVLIDLIINNAVNIWNSQLRIRKFSEKYIKNIWKKAVLAGHIISTIVWKA
jgi:hypothetical protein